VVVEEEVMVPKKQYLHYHLDHIIIIIIAAFILYSHFFRSRLTKHSLLFDPHFSACCRHTSHPDAMSSGNTSFWFEACMRARNKPLQAQFNAIYSSSYTTVCRHEPLHVFCA
jgi:hypothetical protein